MESLVAATGPRMYPHLQIANNQNPNKLYAIPLLGFLIKCIMIIPVLLFLFLIEIGLFFTTILINPFVVLFTGKYWQPAYELGSGFIRYGAKMWFFMTGVTDTYPGFDIQKSEFTLDIPMPTTPNRLFAIPFLGLIARFILLIPYLLWVEIIIYGSFIAVFFSFFSALVMGRYPQVTYEFVKDSYRVNLALSIYLFGLSDTYPSFWIDLKNSKWLKILLIVAGAAFFVVNQVTSRQSHSNYQYNYYGNYQNGNDNNYNLPTSLPGQNQNSY